MKAWSAWVELLSCREPATSLAVSRIVAGSTVCFHLSVMAWSGVAKGAWLDQAHGGAFPITAIPPLNWIGGATALNVYGLLALGVIASAFMTAGAFTRAASILTWFAFRTLTGLNDDAGGASDDLLINVLFLLMLSGCGNALSVDANLRGKTGDVPAWPRWLMILQIAVMYWTTALQKVSVGWLPGGPLDAIWFILQQPTWQRFPMRWVAPYYRLTQLATLATWSFEQAAPLFLLALWYRATRERGGRARAWFNRYDLRAVYLVTGLAIHGGIWMLMEVGPFLNGVLATYACCIRPGEWNAFLARLRALRENPPASVRI